jgi:hypothetical protein
MAKISWYKLGSAAQLIDELSLGPTFSWVGASTYNPCQFDDGSYSNNSGNYLLSAAESNFDANNNVVDAWYNFDFSATDGVPSDAASHVLFEWNISAANRILWHFEANRFNMGVKVANIWYNFYITTNLTFSSSTNTHFGLVYKRAGIDSGSNTRRLYLNGVNIASTNVTPASQSSTNGTYRICSGVGFWELDGIIDDLVLYDDEKTDFSDRIYEGRVEPVPDIIPVDYDDSKPRVLILNSQYDLYANGYVDKIIKTQEKKTFQRDKVIVNQITLPVHNINDQFNPDNPSSIFNGINWRYQPLLIYDEDDNLIWNGIIDDFVDDQNGKRVGIKSKNSLLELFQTNVDYESSDWETPGDAFKNICDDYGVAYNEKYVTDSISQYTANSCYIKCNFNPSDDIKFQQAIEKIAKFGAADCYSANNELCFKLWVPFTGGVKFSLTESDLRKNVKSKLSRVYYNNYKIGYSGDAGTPTTDEDNNYIGEVSVDKNGNHDIVLDGSDNKQIEIKDLTSAIFLGEQSIKRSHIKLSSRPFPPLIIDFATGYEHKDYFTLNTFFRLTQESKGWTNKLFEAYIINRDYGNKIIDITAYEVDE